jgi:hypothetical protein
MKVSWFGHSAAVEVLINHGANVHEKNNVRMNELMILNE